MTKREKYRLGLHGIYLPFYDALCEKLSDEWQPISGFRTMEEQKKLYSQGRGEPGDVVTNSPPGKSMHNYGLATDWGYHIDGKWQNLEFDDPTWKIYIDSCKSLGLRCISWERPHNELSTHLSILMLYSAYDRGGLAAVNELIRSEHGTVNS